MDDVVMVVLAVLGVCAVFLTVVWVGVWQTHVRTMRSLDAAKAHLDMWRR